MVTFFYFSHVLVWAAVICYSRQVVLNNIYFHTRLWKTWHVMKAQFLLHAFPSWLSLHRQRTEVYQSHPQDPDHLPEALCPDSFRLGIKFEHVSFEGAHWRLAFIVTEGTVQTAGEKGHQRYCTALTPEFCNTNLPSKMRSLVQDWHEVQYWNCHSWNVL